MQFSFYHPFLQAIGKTLAYQSRFLSFAGNKIPAKTQNVIDGKFLDSSTSQWVDVHNPATNDVVTKTPCTTHDEMNAAVESAKVAFKSWSKTSPLQRQGNYYSTNFQLT